MYCSRHIFGGLALTGIFFLGASAGSASSSAPVAPANLAGTYRCWSYNAGGAGSRPPIGTPPLVLKTDGTYAISSEHGMYTATGGTVVLSASKIRGPGHLVGGNKIVFEYDYKGRHYIVTYLRQ
ncbi:MAG: hypothetical protein KGJ37_03275 [Verrucomicrobiota bacterium]|nr:hypothetical protein [Verrucomicrobiota bacterium]